MVPQQLHVLFRMFSRNMKGFEFNGEIIKSVIFRTGGWLRMPLNFAIATATVVLTLQRFL